jgi:hypothetical protein
MPNLNLDLSYFEWPETMRLVGALGRGAEVLPLRLKAYCGRVKSRDGKLSGISARGVEAVMQWWGEPGKAVEVLCRPGVGFLRALEDGYEVMEREGVQWADAQGHLELYEERARAGAKARWKGKKPEPPAAPPKEQPERLPEKTSPAYNNASSIAKPGDEAMPPQGRACNGSSPSGRTAVTVPERGQDQRQFVSGKELMLETIQRIPERTPDEQARRQRLYEMRFPFRGNELYGVRVGNLPKDSVHKLLHEWPGRHNLHGPLLEALRQREQDITEEARRA